MARVRVNSEIAGTVWKIEKNAGDAVEADDTIVILEAMKMEIPVLAPTAGTVAELLVGEGDAVEEEGPVAVIET